MTDDPQSEDLTLGSIIEAACRQWIPLSVAALIGLVFGYSASYAFKPLFTSEALLVHVDELLGGSQASGGGATGGFASLIGIGSLTSRDNESLATLKSRALIQGYIEEKKLIPILFEDKWDPETQSWKTANKAAPSLQDGFNLMSKTVLKVKSDGKTGLITVSAEWKDPELARAWINDLVVRTNRKLRGETIARGEQNLKYLNEQLQQTSMIEIRTSIYRLIESEVKKIMFAHGSEDYAFRFVDPPFIPEKRSFPNRAILAAMGGAFALLVMVFWLYAFGNQRKPITRLSSRQHSEPM